MGTIAVNAKRVGRRAVWQRRGWAALSALLLAAAFAPFNQWWAAWFALAPWYAALSNTRPAAPPRTGAGFTLGFVLFLVGMFWLTEIGGVPWFALAVVQGTFFAVFGAIAVRVLPRLPAGARPLVFAAMWTLFEAVRSTGRMAFPWFLLSTSQVRALPLLQIVSITGQWGLSFAVAAACGFLVEALREKGRKRLLFGSIFAGIPAVLALFGWASMRSTEASDNGDSVLLALVQGNEKYREDILPTYDRLTREAVFMPGADGPPALVVWPEGTLPGDLSRNPALYAVFGNADVVRAAGYDPNQPLADWVTNLARTVRTPLVVGDDEQDSAKKWWRMAHLYNGDGTHAATYRKRQLVPFGEFFPLREFLGPIFARYGGDFDDFNPGTEAGVFQFQASATRSGAPTFGAGTQRDVKTGLLICYEDAFPYVAREAIQEGAQILTFITSDQSFGTSAGPYQHLDMAQVRAVETRRSVARCTTTGVSTLIRPTGAIERRLGLGEQGVLLVKPRLRTDHSLFVRWGDWWLWVCGAIAVSGCVYPLWMRASRVSRQQTKETQNETTPS